MSELTKKQRDRIIRLIGEKKGGQQAIADMVGVSRYKVRVVEETLKVQKVQVASEEKDCLSLEDFREQIVEWSREKDMSAFLITRRLKELNVKTSESSVKRFLSKTKREVYVPMTYHPGEEAQVDFGYFGKFDKDGLQLKVWCFCMVLSYSRYAYYTIVTDQTTASFIRCHQEAFNYFGGIPKSVKIDNLSAAVKEADQFEPLLQKQYSEFLEYHGTTAVTTRICRGQDKGVVEAGIKFVKNNFLKNLTHRNYHTLITDLKIWNKQQCNLRVHGTTRKIPIEEFIKYEKSKLLPLPALPYKLVQREQRTANGYAHVFYKQNFYSVPWQYAHEKLIIETDGTQLKAYKGERIVAIHNILDDKGKHITKESHKPLYKQAKNALYYHELAAGIGDNALKLLELMMAEKPLHWKTMFKAILRLTKPYVRHIVDLACEKAILDAKHSYRHVRYILSKKLYRQQEPPPRYPKGTDGYFHDLAIYDQIAKKVGRSDT